MHTVYMETNTNHNTTHRPTDVAFRTLGTRKYSDSLLCQIVATAREPTQ